MYNFHSNGELTFHKQVRETILSGYFWENLFFFSTDLEIYLLVSELKNDVILVKLATLELDGNFPIHLTEYDDENLSAQNI